MVRAHLTPPKLESLPAAERDVQELLHRFEEAVHCGAPCSFATLRGLWQEMHFSYVFETRPLDLTNEMFVQLLFASALDCLQVPLRPRGAGEPTKEKRGRKPTPRSGGPAEATKQGPMRASSGVSHAQYAGMSMEELIQTSDDEDLPEYEPLLHEAEPGSMPAAGGSRDVGATEAVEDPSPANGGEDTTDQAALRRQALELLPDLGGIGELEDADPTGDHPPAWHETCNLPQALRSLDVEVVKIGAVFVLYALYKAQRTAPIVRIYLPLQLLKCLTPLVGRNRDADAILRQLVADEAFLYGAVRRPISGTAAARSAGMPIQRVLHRDRLEVRRLTGLVVRQLGTSASSWPSLQHTQLLCNSYKAAQQRLWGEEYGKAQGVFDLSLGDELGRLGKEIEANVLRCLLNKAEKPLLALEAPPTGKETPVEAARPAPTKSKAKRRKRTREASEALPEAESEARNGSLEELETGIGECDGGLSGDVDIDDDMPSLEDLGLSMPGHAASEDASEAHNQFLPTAARLVQSRKRAEEHEYRRSMAGWQTIIQSRTERHLQRPEPTKALSSMPRESGASASPSVDPSLAEQPGRDDAPAAAGPSETVHELGASLQSSADASWSSSGGEDDSALESDDCLMSPRVYERNSGRNAAAAALKRLMEADAAAAKLLDDS